MKDNYVDSTIDPAALPPGWERKDCSGSVKSATDQRGAGTVCYSELPTDVQVKINSGSLKELDVFELFCSNTILQKLVEDANAQNSEVDFQQKRKEKKKDLKLKKKRVAEHPPQTMSFEDCQKVWKENNNKKQSKRKKKDIIKIIGERKSNLGVEFNVLYKDENDSVWEPVRCNVKK